MLSQILSLIIFALMFFLVLWGNFPRHLVTLSAGGLMIVLVFLLVMGDLSAVGEALSLDSFHHFEFWFSHFGITEFNTGINWSTILFLVGMMVMVEEMSEAGFFDWLCLWLAKRLHFRPMPLMLCFMVLSALLSMFVDSITVILFLSVATVRLAHFLHFDPVPLIIAEIFTANLGGAATMSGDPPNIILGTSLGLGFWDFIRNNGVICLVGLEVVLVYFALCFRTKLRAGIGESDPALLDLNPADAIPSKGKFLVSVGIFAGVILLIMTHAATGLTMPTIGVMAAAMTLTCTRSPRQLLRQVDWKTVGFIIGLSVTVSGLEQTHVLGGLANFLAGLSGGSHFWMVVILIWFTAAASAFVDNIPMATVMVPVILSLSETMGMDLHTLAWTMSKGTDIGGIATPIGASANVAGIAAAAREGHRISWGRYCKYAAPAALLVLILSMVMILTLH